MKKTLVALAALAATSAFAQNAVSLYGTMDIGAGNIVQKLNDAVRSTRSGAEFSAHDTSRWGLTGTEDLGGGLAAEFKIESNIGSNPRSGLTNTNPGGLASAKEIGVSSITAPNTSGNGYTLDATTLGDREFFVAVKSGAARVQAGFGTTALRNLAVQTDAAGSNQVGNVIAHEVGGFRRAGVRVDYTIAPGVVAQVEGHGNRVNNTGGTSTAGGETRASTGTGYTYNLQYTNGAVNAGIGYDESTLQNAPANTTGSGSSNLAAYNMTYKTTMAGGSYDAGVAKLFAQYLDQNAVYNGSTTGTAINEGKVTGTSVGVRVPVGAATFFAQSFNGKDKRYVVAGTGESRKFTGSSFGVRYDVSKRTYAYLNTGKIKKDAATDATNLFGQSYNLKQTAFGLVHSF